MGNHETSSETIIESMRCRGAISFDSTLHFSVQSRVKPSHLLLRDTNQLRRRSHPPKLWRPLLRPVGRLDGNGSKSGEKTSWGKGSLSVYLIIYRVLAPFQVVGNGISEPSTVGNAIWLAYDRHTIFPKEKKWLAIMRNKIKKSSKQWASLRLSCAVSVLGMRRS